MNLFMMLFIVFGLAMDSFSASISSGLASKGIRFNDALRMASFFGSFQAVIPIFEWF